MSRRTKLLAGLACWAGVGLIATAQSPTVRRVYTNKSLFTVPLKMEDGDRAKITGLKCYVKPPGGGWGLHDAGSAQTSKFTFQASSEGEYLFAFATVDAAGRESPAKPDLDGPKLAVVVDTQLPEFVASPVTVASGQTFIQVIMRDANPDPTTITAEAEQPDGSFMPLLPHDKESPGFFRSPTPVPSRIRVAGKDRAGNPTVQVVSIAGATGGSAVATAPAMPAPVVVPPTVPLAPPVVNPPLPAPVSPAVPNRLPAPDSLVNRTTPEPVLPRPEGPKAIETPAPKPVLPDPVLPRVAEKPVESPTSVSEQLVGNLRVSLNYAIDGIVPSAVTKLEAYAVHEDSRRWMKIGEDSDRTSPIEVTLPAEGRWGIHLAVSAAMRPAAPPTANEQPDWWIEVDTTAPLVSIDSATLGQGDETGLLVLQWSIRDKHLKSDTVDAYWSSHAEGPWQPIARGLRAEGPYRWPIPREAGARVFIKIEAQDRAGNVGRAVTPQPVSLEAPRPRGRVLGINPAAVRQ